VVEGSYPRDFFARLHAISHDRAIPSRAASSINSHRMRCVGAPLLDRAIQSLAKPR
jgi:hypothetical protein